MPASTLRELQNEYNALLLIARDTGAISQSNRFRFWTQVPASVAEGRARIECLRASLRHVPPTLTVEALAQADALYPARTAQIRHATLNTTTTPLPRIALSTEELPTDLTFGVEIECFLPPSMTMRTLAAKIAAVGVACNAEMYNHTVRDSWKVVTDGSLGDYARGCEVVSPILRGQEGFKALRKVCDALVAARCSVRRSCGLHVHIGARDEPVAFFKNLATIYAKYEDTICTVLAPSRRENIYARHIAARVTRAQAALARTRTVETTLSALGFGNVSRSTYASGRYSSLNFHAYWQHGTVEFRHHQGTIEANKAINWIKLCMRMVAIARRRSADVQQSNDLPAMLDFLGATQDERAYFTARATHFANRGTNYQERR